MSGSRRKTLWRAFPGKFDGRMWTWNEWRAFKRAYVRRNAALAPNRNRKAVA